MGVEDSSAANGALETRPWWELRFCLALVILATMLPLLYPTIPPLVDLFGHMGRYRVELDLNQSSWLQLYYNYHWAAIGNLGVDLLIIPLGKLLGLEPAVKLIVVLIPPITAAGFLWVAARGARSNSAERLLRAAVHLRLSVHVRICELRAFRRTRLRGVRPLA